MAWAGSALFLFSSAGVTVARSLLLAMATDGLSLVRIGEIYFSAAIGTGLALLYCALVAFAFPVAPSPFGWQSSG